jgi:hypothetical protein
MCTELVNLCAKLTGKIDPAAPANLRRLGGVAFVNRRRRRNGHGEPPRSSPRIRPAVIRESSSESRVQGLGMTRSRCSRLCYDNPQKNPERGTGGGQYAAMPRRMRCAPSGKLATQTKTISSSARLRTRHVVLLESLKILLMGDHIADATNRYMPKVTLFTPIRLAVGREIALDHSGEVLDCRIDAEESSFLLTKIQNFNKFSLATYIICPTAPPSRMIRRAGCPTLV